MMKRINNALISVFYKDGLEEIVRLLEELNIKIYSTGGTYDFVKGLGINAISVESVTSYPSILGGRVKTLHPKIFGGILGRRDHESDLDQMKQYEIPEIDLVVVDLYPFEKTVASTTDEEEIIEKIDIGGISLIRAAAKNFRDVIIISAVDQYSELTALLKDKKGFSDLSDRKSFAAKAFHVSSHYDTAIWRFFSKDNENIFKQSLANPVQLRYGENPHQKGMYFGEFNQVFEKLRGKEISYNNIGDLDAAIGLIDDFDETTFAVLKHNNACGVASRPKLAEAWKAALAGDPVSAFGGVLITNAEIDKETALEIDKLFFEIILAPAYHLEALEILKSKKNRIILVRKTFKHGQKLFRSALNGVIVQDRDLKTETESDLKVVTNSLPNSNEIADLLFANKIVKHSRSNAIVLAKNKQLLGSGAGQTSRVDALKQAIAKAQEFGFNLHGAVMSSDAFFPFADSVELAFKAGISAIIQPGGSVRDQDSIDFCNKNKVGMVFTGYRHFKH
jgi:phosphoribosylaminoimidazolecarboxamide formyltransferase / IMP cyclohydrolase